MDAACARQRILHRHVVAADSLVLGHRNRFADRRHTGRNFKDARLRWRLVERFVDVGRHETGVDLIGLQLVTHVAQGIAEVIPCADVVQAVGDGSVPFADELRHIVVDETEHDIKITGDALLVRRARAEEHVREVTHPLERGGIDVDWCGHDCVSPVEAGAQTLHHLPVSM